MTLTKEELSKIPVPKTHPDYSFHLAYAHHRKRVEQSQSVVQPWNKVSGSIVRVAVGKLKKDWKNNFTKLSNDLRVLLNLNKAQMMSAMVDSFQRKKFPEKTLTHKVKLLEKIEEENYFIGIYITRAKPEIDVVNERFIKKRRNTKFKIPKSFLDKYPNCPINLPKDCGFMEFFLYPKIYLETAVEGLNFGRVEIQLYMEAAPQVVRDLVKLCFEKQVERFRITKMFVDLWIAFEIALPADSGCFDYIDVDKDILKNLNQTGILSFSEQSLGSYDYGLMNFTVAVRPISVLNERRVPFGRVVSNFGMLEQIQEYGTPKGNPKKHVHVIDCGLA